MALSQKRFAELLTRAMELRGMRGTDLERLTGIHPTTLSRYRSADYKSGPPNGRVRRSLEVALRLPSGYLDDAVSVTDEELIRLGPVPLTPEAESLEQRIDTILSHIQAEADSQGRVSIEFVRGIVRSLVGAVGVPPARVTTSPTADANAVAERRQEALAGKHRPPKPDAKARRKRG